MKSVNDLLWKVEEEDAPNQMVYDDLYVTCSSCCCCTPNVIFCGLK